MHIVDSANIRVAMFLNLSRYLNRTSSNSCICSFLARSLPPCFINVSVYVHLSLIAVRELLAGCYGTGRAHPPFWFRFYSEHDFIPSLEVLLTQAWTPCLYLKTRKYRYSTRIKSKKKKKQPRSQTKWARVQHIQDDNMRQWQYHTSRQEGKHANGILLLRSYNFRPTDVHLVHASKRPPLCCRTKNNIDKNFQQKCVANNGVRHPTSPFITRVPAEAPSPHSPLAPGAPPSSWDFVYLLHRKVYRSTLRCVKCSWT